MLYIIINCLAEEEKKTALVHTGETTWARDSLECIWLDRISVEGFWLDKTTAL